MFTTGTWYWVHHDKYSNLRSINSNTDKHILYTQPESFDQTSDDAKLIANAPKLYYSLRYALKMLRRLSDEGHYPQFMLVENGGRGFRPITSALCAVDGQDYTHGLDDLSKDGEQITNE